MSEMNIVSQLYGGSVALDDMKKQIQHVADMLRAHCEECTDFPEKFSATVSTSESNSWTSLVWRLSLNVRRDRYNISCVLLKDNALIFQHVSEEGFFVTMNDKQPEVKYVHAVYETLGGFIGKVFEEYPDIKGKLQPFLDTAELQ